MPKHSIKVYFKVTKHRGKTVRLENISENSLRFLELLGHKIPQKVVKM